MGHFMQSAESLGTLLFHASWHAALLAIVVASIIWAAGKQITPRWQFLLWGVVFVRLACPMLPSSVLSAANLQFAAEIDPAPRPSSLPDTSATELRSQSTHAELYTPVTPNDEVAPVPKDGPAKESVALMPRVTEPVEAQSKLGKSDEAATMPVELVWLTIFFIWIVVTGMLMVRFLWRHRQLRMLTGDCWPADDPCILELLEDCRRRLGIRRTVRLLLSEKPIGPATFGVVGPRIVLPESLLPSLNSRELRMVLLHELTHVRRLDILWDHLALVIATMHWFNPFAWWVLGRLRDARELAADAAMLTSLEPKEVKSYGHLIVNLAARQIAPRSQTVLVGAVGNARLLHRRIEMIASYRKPSWKQTLLGATILGLLALCGLTSAQTPKASEEESAKAVSEEEKGTSPKVQQQSTADECVISGIFTDEDKRPLDDVRVRLFRVDGLKIQRELLQDIETDADGKFHFGNLPAPRSRELTDSKSGENYDDTYYVLAATKPGQTSRLKDFHSSEDRTQDLSISMPKAGTLSGRVTDNEGRPVQGAKVFTQSSPFGQPLEGVLSDTTDSEGRYSLNDLELWDAAEAEAQRVLKKESFVTTGFSIRVLHPNFGWEYVKGTKVPSTIDVSLKPGAIIEGKVIDQVTGKPSEAIVTMQGTRSGDGFHQATTDNAGKYRLTSVAPGQYHIWANAKARSCIAIDSLTVERGKTYSDQDIPLVEGGWLEGRIVDARTGEPISDADGRRISVACYGPSRPKSRAAGAWAQVDQHGRFGLRVGPGKNYPYLLSEIWNRTEDVEKFREGIEVGDGELVVLEFKVLPEVPRENAAFSPVRLPIPVAEEREAAAAIRRLGGWYKLDDEKHVVEVNMTHHYTEDKVRYDNDQANTDEALQWMPKFPKLQRLYLKDGQATDEGLRFLAELSELETFFAWDAAELTDAGVKHLASLKKLKEIHITHSKISDGALQVFGGLKDLERLSVQGHHFTDRGIPHLSHLEKLKALWIGIPQAKLTEEIAPHLARLTNLEELELQGIQFTDEGIMELKPLTKLRLLYLHGSVDKARTLTDASAEVLRNLEEIQKLHIRNCRLSEDTVKKLAALPNLKELLLEGTSVSRETETNLKRKYPNAAFYLHIQDR